MGRIFKVPGKAINSGGRIPLSQFREPIVVLRAESKPSPADESWTREAVVVGRYMSAVEEGERKLIASDKQKDSELFLFLIHGQIEHEFTLCDYVVWGREVYHVQGYLPLGGLRGYTQINARPWGMLQDGDFILNPEADVHPVREEPASRDNLFWPEE